MDMKICGQCDFKYDTIPQLMSHVKKAKDHSPLCVQCNNTKFSNFNNYRHHIRKFHMNYGDVICSECGKTSKTQEQQMLHWNFVHKEEDDLYCNICGTKCKNMFKLRNESMTFINPLYNEWSKGCLSKSVYLYYSFILFSLCQKTGLYISSNQTHKERLKLYVYVIINPTPEHN